MNAMEHADKLISDAQAELTEMNELKQEISDYAASEKEAGKIEGLAAGEAIGYDKGYDVGFKDAEAGNGGDPLKIFTLEDLNTYGAQKAAEQAVADKAVSDQEKAALQEVIDSKQLVIDGIEGQVKNAVDESLAAFKAEVKSKLQEQQSAENAGEAAFASLLD